MEDMEKRSNCTSFSSSLFMRSPAQLTRRLASSLRLVNASELERLKKRFMKLDRCFPLTLYVGESLDADIVHRYPRRPSRRNNRPINRHYQSLILHLHLTEPTHLNVSTVIQRWLWFDRPRRVLADPPDRWEPPRIKDDCDFRRRVRPNSPFSAAASGSRRKSDSLRSKNTCPAGSG